MRVENLNETLEPADLIPPAMLLENSEDATENIADVTTASHIAGEGAIFYDHHDSAGVV